jgi:hypothetical protein
MGSKVSKYEAPVKKLIRSTTIRFPWESRWAYTSRVDSERGATDDAVEIWNTHYANDKYYGQRMCDAHAWIAANAPVELVGVPLYQMLVMGRGYERSEGRDIHEWFGGNILKGVFAEREDGWREWNFTIEELATMSPRSGGLDEFGFKKMFWGMFDEALTSLETNHV